MSFRSQANGGGAGSRGPVAGAGNGSGTGSGFGAAEAARGARGAGRVAVRPEVPETGIRRRGPRCWHESVGQVWADAAL
jgi:hypothetical protein